MNPGYKDEQRPFNTRANINFQTGGKSTGE